MIIPDASIDVQVQCQAVIDGEKRAAYFPDRVPKDIPHGLFLVCVSGDGEKGTAAFRDSGDAAVYRAYVVQHGLREANARWLGYGSSVKPVNGATIMVLRNGGVVHDEVVGPADVPYRMQILRTKYPHDGVHVTGCLAALQARRARYNEDDVKRWGKEVDAILASTVN